MIVAEYGRGKGKCHGTVWHVQAGTIPRCPLSPDVYRVQLHRVNCKTLIQSSLPAILVIHREMNGKGKKTMTLAQLSSGESARILDVGGGWRLRRNLEQLGIHPGDIVSVAGTGAFRGPVLVEIDGGRVALGRGVAGRIYVELL